MTAEEFLAIRANAAKVIREAELSVKKARDKVLIPPIDELRRAVADDIAIDAVIYHSGGDDGWFWHVVEEPLHYGDDFKAYVAEDGCRYGLHDAWVSDRLLRRKPNEKS